jgi:hypothetical protein
MDPKIKKLLVIISVPIFVFLTFLVFSKATQPSFRLVDSNPKNGEALGIESGYIFTFSKALRTEDFQQFEITPSTESVSYIKGKSLYVIPKDTSVGKYTIRFKKLLSLEGESLSKELKVDFALKNLDTGSLSGRQLKANRLASETDSEDILSWQYPFVKNLNTKNIDFELSFTFNKHIDNAAIKGKYKNTDMLGKVILYPDIYPYDQYKNNPEKTDLKVVESINKLKAYLKLKGYNYDDFRIMFVDPAIDKKFGTSKN